MQIIYTQKRVGETLYNVNSACFSVKANSCFFSLVAKFLSCDYIIFITENNFFLNRRKIQALLVVQQSRDFCLCSYQGVRRDRTRQGAGLEGIIRRLRMTRPVGVGVTASTSELSLLS